MSSTDGDPSVVTDTGHQEYGDDVVAAPKRTAAGTQVEHFTVAERAARGKAARAEVSRASHGEWEPTLHRADPVELPGEALANSASRGAQTWSAGGSWTNSRR